MKILFICKGNVGRSQIAEGLFRKKFGDKYEVVSAGTEISGPEEPLINLLPQIQEVLDVMKEEGVDLSGAVRKQLTEKMVEDADRVIVIMEEEEILPDYLLNSQNLVRWNIPDPKGKNLDFTREVKNKIKNNIDLLEI